MSGRLTTHVLDTAYGRPAAGVRVELLRLGNDGTRTPLADTVTNADGRVDAPLLTAETIAPGVYELRFHVADYYAAAGRDAAGRFLGVVPIVFRIDRPDEHYHVPLLVTPWSYSTYRGS